MHANVDGSLAEKVNFTRRVATVPAPADELRVKLAESRELEAERDEFEAGETPVDQVQDVAARRADVHERARQALDELGGSS